MLGKSLTPNSRAPQAPKGRIARRGFFVTFEGIDGSGKSTQLRRAAEWLEAAGHSCVVTKEPGGTPLGEAIRGVFLDPRWGRLDGTVELMLVFASRRQHWVELIEPAVARGQIVLCDRFTDSTFAYQGAGRGVETAEIDHIDEVATGRLRPDLTLLFDLPVATARARRAADAHLDRLDSEEVSFQERVREAFLDLSQREPERFRQIDSSLSVEAMEGKVREVLGSGVEAWIALQEDKRSQ